MHIHLSTEHVQGRKKVDVIKSIAFDVLCSFYHLLFSQEKVVFAFNDATNYLQFSVTRGLQS